MKAEPIEPICIMCDVERVLIDITPVRNRHEMLKYECPKCRSVFRLVAQRKRRELAEANSGHGIASRSSNWSSLGRR